ncbi:MAG: nucleotide sugar dehydrogenase [Alphaproteobacteria bacterium]
MSADLPWPPRIAVIGLGYVGLPLAVALARHFPVTGFDIAAARIAELQRNHDRTGEIDDATLAASSLTCTAEVAALADNDLYIVTVPTPVTAANEPDLSALLAACATLGPRLIAGAVVVFESTVYPGVTEEICGPALARASGLTVGDDLLLGYSPERINPGDREHTVDRITKIVAGQTPAVTDWLARVYGAMNGDNIHRAPNIKTAEAAKAIENAQRDINIAFVNEVAMIAQALDLSVFDILDAANTKWNFLKFQPGLVGGHCIGVDPYYLAARAKQAGHDPRMILSGRSINDSVGNWLAGRLADLLGKPSRVLVLGLTFKENVPDLRNTKVVDLVDGMRRRYHTVDVHDAIADPAEAKAHHGIDLLTGPLSALAGYDAVIGTVPHRAYADLDGAGLAALLVPGGLVADVKGMWRGLALPDGLRRWQF